MKQDDILDPETQQIQIKLDSILNHFQQTYPQAVIVCEKIEEQEFQLSIPLEIYDGMCRIIIVISIDFSDGGVVIDLQLADEYGRIQVQEKMLRLQVGRYILKLNPTQRVGAFYINPIQGHVGCKLFFMNEYFKENLVDEESYSQEIFNDLDDKIQKTLHSMKFHFMRLLFLMNKIKIKDFHQYEKYMEEQKKVTQWRKIPKEGAELVARIKAITDQKCLVPIVPSEPKEIENLKQKINVSRFINIYLKSLYYQTIQDGQPEVNNAQKRTLVVKKEKDSNGERVSRERQILLTLANSNNQLYGIGDQYIKKNGCCPYIAQFYYVPDKKDTLLMERYFHDSLDQYLEKYNQEMLSLSTKLHFAKSIALGLRYIHSYKIVHMGIRPANILISKKLMAKITNFEDSINLELKENYKSAKTYPYVAPEMIQGKEITTAYDIFAFGTLLFKLIFDRYPIDFNKDDIQNFENRMFKGNYLISYNEEYDKTIGPKVIVKYLARMCIQCLQPEPEKRPNIDKIYLVLKYCQIYLDKVY